MEKRRRTRVGDKYGHMGIKMIVKRRRIRRRGEDIEARVRDFGGSGGFVYGCFWPSSHATLVGGG